MTRQTVSDRYFIYKTGIKAPGVLANRPVRNGGDAREIGVLVYNPGGLNLTIRKQAVIRPNGQLTVIPVSGVNLTVQANITHMMRVGEQVTITKSNSVPSIDGTYPITAVTEKSFTITVGAPVTSAGIYAEFEGPERLFTSATFNVGTISAETIVDHTGGNFILEIIPPSPAGPYSDANAVDLMWRAV